MTSPLHTAIMLSVRLLFTKSFYCFFCYYIIVSILIIGADYDLILEMREHFSSKEIIGYTSNTNHFYTEIPYFGSLRDKSE